MKRTLNIIAIFASVCSSAQNNNIFYGGDGDGWSKAAYAQTSINILFNGGDGDGWNKASYSQNTIATLFHGGEGDGWNQASYAQNTATTMFKGGDGDGWNNSNYLQGTLSPQFSGGDGDGWNSNNYHQTYADVAFRGGMGDGWASTYTPLAPLPVTFLKFEAHKKGDASLLSWLLAEEEGVASFDVERSTNAVSFEKIGNIVQDNSAKDAYNFVDNKPFVGNNYYRLKVIGKDGKHEYTGTRVVNFGQTHSSKMNIYPNPATDIVNVELPGEFSTAQHIVVNVYAMNGVMVYHQRMAKGYSLITIPTEKMAAGNYVIHIATDNSQTADGKLTIIK